MSNQNEAYNNASRILPLEEMYSLKHLHICSLQQLRKLSFLSILLIMDLIIFLLTYN